METPGRCHPGRFNDARDREEIRTSSGAARGASKPWVPVLSKAKLCWGGTLSLDVEPEADLVEGGGFVENRDEGDAFIVAAVCDRRYRAGAIVANRSLGGSTEGS